MLFSKFAQSVQSNYGYFIRNKYVRSNYRIILDVFKVLRDTKNPSKLSLLSSFMRMMMKCRFLILWASTHFIR